MMNEKKKLCNNGKNKVMKEEVVYILGAGFSAPLGIPVMGNFLEKSKDLYFNTPESFPYFKDVFEMIQRMSVSKNYYETDLFNIEEILSILEMESFINVEDKSIDFKKFIIDVIESYTPKLTSYPKACPINWKNFIFGDGRSNNLGEYGNFIGSLFGLTVSYNRDSDTTLKCTINDSIGTKYNVLSLNYDLVLESLVDLLNNDYKKDDDIKLKFNKSKYDSNSTLPSLYKLHGSVDTKLIVPPTWSKGNEPEIRPIWKNAYQSLKSANHIRFIGYSLPVSDSYIKYLLKAAILKNEHLKSIDVICLDSDNSVRKRFTDFITYKKLRFINADTIDYIKKIAELTTLTQRNGVRRAPVTFNQLELAHKTFMEEH